MAVATAGKKSRIPSVPGMQAEPLTDPSLQERFKIAEQGINQSLIEREEDVRLMFVALVSGNHCLFVGAPGTAKSQMVDAMTGVIEDATKFDILMSKFTDPVETEGPLVVSDLIEGKYNRQNAGYMTQAHVIFMDEVFKASSAILNTTLKLINERKYRNGGQWHQSPLISLFGASNEYPIGDNYADVAHAFFDRFLFRKTVKPIASDTSLDRLMFAPDADLKSPQGGLKVQDVQDAQQQAANLPLSAEAMQSMKDILRQLALDHKIVPGDRRKRLAVKAVRANAWVSGAERVEPEHLDVLQHVLWLDPVEHPQHVASVVLKAANPDLHAVNDLLSQAREISVRAETTFKNSSGDAAKLTQFFVECKKFDDIVRELTKLNKNSPTVKKAADWARAEIKRLKLMPAGGE